MNRFLFLDHLKGNVSMHWIIWEQCFNCIYNVLFLEDSQMSSCEELYQYPKICVLH